MSVLSRGGRFEDESFNNWDVWGNEVESDIELEVK